jgi:hypothetical protein
MIRIRKIDIGGHFDFRRLTPEAYSKTRRDFVDDWGISLPTAKELDLVNEDDLRMLLDPMVVHIHLKGGAVWRYSFRKGFIYDTASVPKFFRSIVDNDDRHLLLAAMVHDVNFRCHYLSFAKTNRLFRKMILEAGGSRWLAFKCWLAVSSPVGIYLFRKWRKSKSVIRFRKWCGFTKMSKGQWDRHIRDWAKRVGGLGA